MERSETLSRPPKPENLEDTPSIGYICPLYTELVAVCATFDEDLGVKETDQHEYYYGRIGGRMAVAVHFLHREMGPQAASKCADSMLKEHPTLKHSRSVCLLVGIAGGIWTDYQDIRLGDVVIATQIWNWRDGKLTEHGLETTHWPKDVSTRLLQSLPSFLYYNSLGQSVAQWVKLMREKDRTNDARWTYPGREHDRLFLQSYSHVPRSLCASHDPSKMRPRAQRGDDLPRIHDGLIASGNVVLKETKSWDILHEKHVHAVEMEACGVPDDFIVIRGISDYADSHKNDVWQPYAAAVAAACSRILIDHLVAKKSQDPAHLHRLKSCPSDLPSPSQAQQASSSSPTFIRTSKDLTDRSQQPPPPRRVTQSDFALSLDDSLLSAAGKTQVRTSTVTKQLPLRSVTPSAKKRASTFDSLGAKNITEDVVPISRRSRLIDSIFPRAIQGMVDEHLQSAPRAPGDTWYTATYEWAMFELYDLTKTPPMSTRRHAWTKPTVTMRLQDALGAYTAYAPACYLIFTSSDVDGRLHDRVWLPFSGLKITTLEGSLRISYRSVAEEGSSRQTSVLLTSGSLVEAVLVLKPQDKPGSSQDLLIEHLLRTCRSLISDLDAPPSVLDNELVHGAMKCADDGQHVLYIHQVDRYGTHYCTLRAFSQALEFKTSWHSDHIEVSLEQMQCLRYIDPAQIIELGLKRSAHIPYIGTHWISSPQTETICRDLAPNCMEKLLTEAVGGVAGWTAINATEGVSLTSLHDRSTNRLHSSLISKIHATLYRKVSAKCILTTWQCGDSIRFFMYHPRVYEEEVWDEWTIKAGRGEIFLRSDYNSKLKVAFELDTPSRSSRAIRMTFGEWFTLGESEDMYGGDSISLKFLTPESYTKFKRSIDTRFWR